MTPATPAPGPIQQFSTEQRRNSPTAAQFEEKLRSMFALDVALSCARPRQLSAHMTAYRGRNLRFATVCFSPHATASAGGPRRPDSRVLLSLHRQGHAVVAQGGRETSMEPGDIFVVDPSLPCQIITGDIETRSVYLTRSTLVALVPDLDDLTALRISSERGPGAILRAALDAMFDSAPVLDEATADHLADAIPHLLAAALLHVRRGHSPIPSRLRLMHKQQIRRFVLDNLGDSQLSAATIADGVHLSPRHVYEVFSDESEPLMKWVWSERLQRCGRDLAEPRLQMRTIGEVAYAWGFSDASHFSRAFKLKFRASPRQFRQEALGKGDAGVPCRAPELPVCA